MTALNDCPSDEQLKALLDDRLTPEMSQQVIEHIDQCPICQAKLADPIGLGELASQLPNIKIDKRVSPRLKTALESTKLMSVQMYGSGSGEAEGSIELTPEVTAFTQDGYDLLEQIGQGGMGIVFRAREWSLDRIVAVKVLSPLLASDSSSRTRFLREARSAAAVVHPNVITIHAVSEKHALPYIVSEFVEGVSLQQQLDSDAGISLDNIIRIGRQIAAGLSAAHQKGVIHRDIKPANILLNAKTGKVLLGDFGLARSSEQGHLTRTGMLLGTPAYIAPECLEDPKSADQRADLFSLGAVMYAMCTGDSPFAADTLLGTLQRLSSFQPKSLAEQIPGMPEWFSDCVMKLLARYPEDRFQTAAEFRDALGQGNGSGSGRPVELELGRAGRVTGIATRSNKDTPTLNANDVTIPLMPTADQVQTDDQTGTRSSIVINTDPDSTRSRTKKRSSGIPIGWMITAAVAVTIVGIIAFPMLVPGWSRTPESESTAEVRSPNESDSNRMTGREERPSFAPEWRPEFDGDQDFDGDHFVCLDASGEPTGRFGFLQDAIDSVEDDGEIEIRTNDMIIVDTCCFLDSDITIVAGEEYSPVLTFEAVEGEDLDALFHVEGRLTLRGIEIRIPDYTENEDMTLIHVEAFGELRMDDCALIAESSGICLSTHSDVTMNHCQIHAPQSTAIELESHEDAVLSLNNCWVSGETMISLTGENKQQIRITDSSFACEQFLNVFAEDQSPLDMLTIRSERSVYFCSLAFMVVEELYEKALTPVLDWQGSKNVYASHRFLLTEMDELDDDIDEEDSGDWPVHFRQSGTFSDRPFLIDPELLAEQISELDFRLAEIETSAEISVGARE